MESVAPSFYFIAPILVVMVGVLVFFYFQHRKSSLVNRSLGYSLYEVNLPRAVKEEGKSFRDFISAMEQFYVGMSELGSDYALEIVSPASENETNFYVSVPYDKFSFFEKQVHSVFPSAEIREEKGDYSIFKYNAPSVGAVVLLEKKDILPIRTYKDLETDPLEVIINTFSKLSREKEGAAVQIIVEAGKNGLNDKIGRAVELLQSGRSIKDALGKEGEVLIRSLFTAAMGRPLSAGGGFGLNVAEGEKRAEIIKLLNKKASKKILRANIRLVASAETYEKAQVVLNEIKSAFSQFADMQGNNFIVYSVKGMALKNFYFYFSYRLFNELRAVHLNTEEITGIFHLPSYEMMAPRLKRVTSKKAEPPVNLSAIGVTLGFNMFRDDQTEVRLGIGDRRRHFYTIGQTGTGKSALMKNMAIQDIKEGNGVCFIDPHGDTIEDILGQIPEERWDDVVYFDPSDIKRPLGLNMLEYDPNYPEQKTFIVNELLEIFNKLYDMSTAGGPMFEQYFRNATLLVMDDPSSGNTLLEISRVMTDKNFRDYKLTRTTNPVVKNFWKEVAEKAGGEASLKNIVPYITSKFDTFLANEIMRPIVSQEKSSFNFREIMDSKKIFLINLAKGRLGELNSHLLGMILIGKLFMAAMSRANVREDERSDFFLYIDEFQNVTTKSIAMILSEARKYRLSLIIAHQFIGQLEENIKKAVFGNVGSMAVFRVGQEDAEFLKSQFEPVFSAEDLANIANCNAYVKLLVGGETTRPFNITTFPPSKSNEDIAVKVKEISSIKYGRSLREIESEINRRYMAGVSVEQNTEAGSAGSPQAGSTTSSGGQTSVSRPSKPIPPPQNVIPEDLRIGEEDDVFSANIATIAQSRGIKTKQEED